MSGKQGTGSHGAAAAVKHDLRGLLAITPFRRLWLSLGLSSFGDWLGLLAATAMAAHLGAQSSYSAANLAVSGVLILRLAPSVVLGPVAGALADRFDRKMLMVVGDLLRFVIFLSIPVIGTLWWLFVATVLAEVVGLFWAPAKDATVPNIVPRSRLEAANQLSLATTYGSAPVAAVLFTLLSLATGVLARMLPGTTPADVAMAFNGLTYLVAALVIWNLDLPRRSGTGEVGTREPSVLRAVLDGWTFVMATRLVRGLVLGMLGAFAAGGFVIGVAPTFATDLGAGEPAYGVLFAAVFTGLALGMWVGPRVLSELARWRLFAIALTAAGVFLFFVALIANIVTAVLFTVLLGMCGGISWVTGYTLLGIEVADEVRGRTFAFVQNGAKIVLIAVMALAPGMAALFGERSLSITDDAVLEYNGAALTLLLAAVATVTVGVVSYRTMDDGTGMSLREDLTRAWGRISTRTRHSPPRIGNGRFVVFEGGDGVGKTTQVRLLASWLRQQGHEVVTTREPGGTDLGASIRSLVLHGTQVDPRAETLLFAADRAQHVGNVINPALDRGAVVISDRYVDSSVAYQGHGRGFDQAGIERISEWATGDLVPDLTVVLDLSHEQALERMRSQGRDLDRMEQLDADFHTRVRGGFLHRAGQAPRRYLVLDATRDPVELAEQVRDRLGPLLTPVVADEPAPGAERSGVPPGIRHAGDEEDPWIPS